MRWAVFTTLCSVFRSAREQLPYHTEMQLVRGALDGAVVEVHQNLRRQMGLIQSPQEEETLVYLIDQG